MEGEDYSLKFRGIFTIQDHDIRNFLQKRREANRVPGLRVMEWSIAGITLIGEKWL